MITLKNLLKHELIGLGIIVKKSLNRSEEGIKGKIVNETKNTFVIETSLGEKRIQKDGRKFIIMLDKDRIDVDGSKLAVRPEDRIKKKIKKWC